MNQRPTIQTPRLILRPFRPEDAPAVQTLAGSYEVARYTLAVPHPYADGMAEAWIAGQEKAFVEKQVLNFAIALRETDELCGTIGLRVITAEQRAELGYWMGVSFWGQGYCTEAARAALNYGFETLDLNRIHAQHFANNPASGRVMQKIGMTWEGTLRQQHFKWGEFVDSVCYGVLRKEWEA